MSDRQKAEAARILADIRAKLKHPAKPLAMPRAVYTTQRDIDRERALEMVAAEIKASLERCAALEIADV